MLQSIYTAIGLLGAICVSDLSGIAFCVAAESAFSGDLLASIFAAFIHEAALIVAWLVLGWLEKKDSSRPRKRMIEVLIWTDLIFLTIYCLIQDMDSFLRVCAQLEGMYVLAAIEKLSD